MTKLNDTQLVLLSSAAQRDTGSLYPLPEVLQCSAEVARKAVAQLIKAKLAEEGPVTDRTLSWREEDDQLIGARITDAGRDAIGAGDAPTGETSTPAATPLPKRQPKSALILDMLHRPDGATLDEITAATGWLPHTARAALTGVRKKGHAVERCKRGELTCYRVAEVA